MMVKTLQVIDTVYSADSVEWCPIDGYQDIMLCGTYQLQKQTEQQDDTVADDQEASGTSTTKQKRLGRLYVYTVQCPDSDQCPSDDPQLRLHTSKDMAGILDIKWCPSLYNDHPVFGLVTSEGHLQIYRADRLDGDNVDVCLLYQSCVSNGECLGLSLDWSNRVDKSTIQITCSSSDGYVRVNSLTANSLDCVSHWKAHDYEAWITAFNYWDTNIIYTGGDDCRLKVWDTRQDLNFPVFSSKRHTMGVCSIQSNPHKENILCTGSYDEQLIVWDTRQMKSPLTETSLGGGIWRIKWEPQMASRILTATMYNGFHIVDANYLDGSDMSIVCHYKEHQSIAYGADWCYLSQSEIRKKSCDKTETCDSSSLVFDNEKLISTCSFYDQSLRLWTWKHQLSHNDT